MYNLNNYKPEITAISAANGNVDIGVASDMFLANIRNAGNLDLPGYPGADHVAYKVLQAHYEELAASKQDFLDEWGKELGYKQ